MGLMQISQHVCMLRYRPRRSSVHIPSPYPPPLGLPLRPVTDHPKALLDVPLSAPTVPAAPICRSLRVHVVRTPSSFGYSAVTVSAPYSDIVHGDNETISTANLTASEVADLLSAAAAAVFRAKNTLSASQMHRPPNARCRSYHIALII
jgi:hypothetical protein